MGTVAVTTGTKSISAQLGSSDGQERVMSCRAAEGAAFALASPVIKAARPITAPLIMHVIAVDIWPLFVALPEHYSKYARPFSYVNRRISLFP